MATLPLTLDTLKSPSNESSLSLPSPLMSPQCLKADSLSTTNDMDTTTERPSNLTIESTHQQQQHSNVTPSPSTTTLHGNISPALSSAGSLSPSFLPEMPQWKRDLIQRRKQNVQRTLSASSPISSLPTTTLTAGGLKTSISSSSVRSLADSNTNIDHLASEVCSTKDYTKTSLLPFANTTTKVNKQYITTNSTNTVKPATNIKSSSSSTILSSPREEKAEKLFGGQYTVTTSSSTFSAKEEITTHQQQQENFINKECKERQQLQEISKMMEENEEEPFEMYRKTKEVLSDETQTEATAAAAAIITNEQQMATRLTGSTYNITTTNTSAASSSSSSSSILKRAETDREKLLNITQPYHNITGANANLVNQSLNKCESERLVCAANTTGSSNNYNNKNNSVTIGGISVSGNISNNQNNCSSVTSVVKISQKLQENQFIKNEQQLNTKKIIKFKQNTISGGIISLDLKSPTKISHVLTSSNSTSCLTSSSSLHSAAATSTSANCAIKKKMVAVQEMKKSTQNSATHLHQITSTWHATNRANNRGGGGGGVDGEGGDADLDNSEDLSYGPGIVSKLRCRYLSLALRESMEQQRLNKDQLRRSTSLNNLLDSTEDEENCDEEEEEVEEMIDEDVENHGFDYKVIRKDAHNVASNIVEIKKSGILKTSVNNGQDKRFSHNSQGSNGVGVTFTETSYNKRSRHLKRGNDSLKRARSVEALLSEKSPWHTRNNSSTPTCVTIEDKIHNARERLHLGTDHMPPKRLTSIIDDTERPPPDLVKQTLKMFEATANRRPRSTNRSNSKGDVASKVETFKNIIKEQKPVVTFPKPLSPTKKLNTTLLHKPLKSSTPLANDLLKSPLGRKAVAATTSINNTNDCLTPIKTNNILSDHTPDTIPRQKLHIERDFKQEIISPKEKYLSNENIKREYIKEEFEVDSPLTALSKELSKLKLNDTTATRKNDNSNVVSSGSDNHEPVNNVGSVGGVGGGDNNGGDACQRHNKYTYNNSNNDFVNEETTKKELNTSSLINDKINNKTKPNTNNEATSSSTSSTTIETKNEAAVNNYDCSTKASSPPPNSSDLSDVGENYDDEYGGLNTTKRITRTALDNIAKAGYTQQFKFNTINQTNSSSTSTNASNSTSSPLNTGKQVGVIRPLLNTQQQQQKSAESNMESLKHSTTTSLTSQEIEKNRINDLKKSSTTYSTNAATTASPSASLDHQMIKPSHTSSPVATTAASATNSSTGMSDVDSVISATNSPLWAMRKRRQTPPAVPAENTSMVFNFSNRKEVPDYIESDGVIFRRKRELPKPNESGFVLLGDLSVETSTDMDYDDFSMCPPSPCDVEFVNANIVIDGKSSIRQKSKDLTFHVQFNDTLTSTFEYPSEASLIVDESFSAYNESYAQPLGSSSSTDDFTLAFQNLNLENVAHHHVADEIIQLPTFNSSSPAATNTTNSPTKNILGNLSLDYPDLQKGIQLTTATQTPNVTQIMTTQEDDKKMLHLVAIDMKKSRKDLKLPLDVQPSLQKPALPVKRFQMRNHPAAVGVPAKLLNFKNSPINLKACELVKQQNKEIPIKEQQQQYVKQNAANENAEGVSKTELIQKRKTPRVLNNPQYACFLQAATPFATKPVQRSRSNEFQKTLATFSVSSTVSRSNSLRNLEYVPANRTSSQFKQPLTLGATSHCFSPEVNSNEYLNSKLSKNEMAKNPNAFENSPIPQLLNNAKENSSNLKITLDPNTFLGINQNNQCSYEEPDSERSQSLNNLAENSENVLNLRESFSKSVDNLESFMNLTNLAEQYIKSLENLNLFSSASKTKKNCRAIITENFHSMSSPENRIPMASSDFKVNDLETHPAALNKDARNNQQDLQHCRGKPENMQKLTEKSYDVSESAENFSDINAFLPQTNCQVSLDLNSKLDNSNSAANISNSALEENLGKFSKSNSNSEASIPSSSPSTTKSAVGKICLTVNTKYVTDYRSKITKNLPCREIKSMENLTSQNTSEPLSLTLHEDDSFKNRLNKKKKFVNVVDNMGTQSKSHDHLAASATKLPTKVTSISNENVSEILEYSLYKNINALNSDSNKTESVQDSSMLIENFQGVPRTSDSIVINDSSKDIMNSDVSSNYLPKELSSSVDNNETGVESKDLSTMHSDNENKHLLKSLAKSLENDVNTEYNLKTKCTNNLIEIVEEPTSPDLGTFRISDNVTNLTKSLQISRDSLDNFEDAEELNQEKLLTDVEASEILDDIAIGLDTSSLFDFNNLLTLRKSKTAYCLKSLEKSASLESKDNENSLQSDDDNFLSACNTLESKCPLKPRDISIANTESSEASSESKPPQVSAKRPKTMRVKTTEKILNLTNMASHNAATYATFRKSKNFYKNASKSFKNSLRFYETFSAKSSQALTQTQSPIKRSVSLSENPTKKAELNRKIFSKSNKLMMKVRNIEEWESPTENSYSFEYFDAEGDVNGNLFSMRNAEDTTNEKIGETFSEINHNISKNSNDNLEIGVNLSNSQGPKQALTDDTLSHLNSNHEILLSKKSTNLKPISSDFCFNNSPRPFKRIYAANTVVNIDASSYKTTYAENIRENKPEIFQAISSKASLNIKPFAVTGKIAKGSGILEGNPNSVKRKFLSAPTAAKSANYTEDSTDCLEKNFPNTSTALINSNNICTLSTPTVLKNLQIQRANSFTTFKVKLDSNNYFPKSGSFSHNISQKVEKFNKNIKQVNYLQKYDNINNNSKQSFRNIGEKSVPNVEKKNSPQVETFNNKLVQSNEGLKLKLNSPLAQKSNPKVENFMRNYDSTEFAFNLTKFSANSPKFADSSSVTESFKNITADCSPKFDAFSATDSSACSTNLFVSTPLIEHFRVGALSSKCSKLSKFDKQCTNFNGTLTPTTYPAITTLTVKDYNKTTATTPTTTITNFPPKVVAIKNSKSSDISYTNSSCSFSSIHTTNKSYTTAKYHQNLKTTTIATAKTKTFIPAPPLKSTATKYPPKVIPRRLFVNAPKIATEKTTTTTCDTTSSSTTSSTCFKASTCTSANNNVAPLRRRIPGNTLYYV